MTEMIERMAKAMREEDPIALSMLTDQDLRELAAAALRAAREPTEAMKAAGLGAWTFGAENFDEGYAYGPCHVWDAMIDEALKEE